MKKGILLICLVWTFKLFSQETAAEYIIPSVRSEKDLIKIAGKSLVGDICNQSPGYGGLKYQVISRVDADGSVNYKIVYFNQDITYYEDRAYYVKFSGINAALTGYSQFESRSGFVFSRYITNEKYQALSGSNYIKVPSESYQTMEWTFVNPKSGSTVKANSYYKNMTFSGQDRRILIVEFNENGKIKKEYFLKHFGLIAMQNELGDIYVVDFKNFNLYNKTFLDGKSEKDLRVFAWTIVDRMRAIEVPDSFYLVTHPNRKMMFEKLDSLNGLLEQMILKQPSMIGVYRYFISIYTKSAIEKLFDNSQKMEKLSYNLSYLMEILGTYYIARPYPESTPKAGLDTYFKGINESYYNQFWKTQYSMFRCINASNDYIKSYKQFLMEPFVNIVLKGESNMSNEDKCVLYSYVSNYYLLKGDETSRYHYMVRSVENYRYLSQTEKDMNIEYMRNVMKSFETL
ncbi:MAG: hypothetical protein JNM67_00920, partial [Bacteroidetes bacterium]|nr:hypothetical protein [Bacteroidota bacterium]